MKTTKRVLAIVLAALMLAMMIPFSVSAATEQVTFNVDCNKAGYTFGIYRLATLDTEDGTYTVDSKASAAVSAAITAADATKSSAAILSAANTASAIDPATGQRAATGYGTKVDTFVSTGSKEITVTSGIYYILAEVTPNTVKSVTNSIVSLPYYDGEWKSTLPSNGTKVTNNTIHLAEKVNEGEMDVTKVITNSKFTGVETYTTAQLGETVNFKLTASVVGSTEKKLQSYKINDTMSEGLTFGSVTGVKLTGGAAADKALTVTSDYTVNKIDDQNFEVILTAATLADNAFYGYSTVEVECNATLNENAVVGSEGNTNEDSLTYKNADGKEADEEGDVVKVYTFYLQVKKVDANSTTTGLDGATFKVYKTEADAAADENAIDEASTKTVDGVKGIAQFKTFKFDANKTYYIKETVAPEGYNLNSAIIEVKTPAATFNSDEELTSPTDGMLVYSTGIPNTPAKLPQTGGPGTIAFTIIGGSLVLIAGALFVVIMRKRRTSK